MYRLSAHNCHSVHCQLLYCQHTTVTVYTASCCTVSTQLSQCTLSVAVLSAHNCHSVHCQLLYCQHTTVTMYTASCCTVSTQLSQCTLPVAVLSAHNCHSAHCQLLYSLTDRAMIEAFKAQCLLQALTAVALSNSTIRCDVCHVTTTCHGDYLQV